MPTNLADRMNNERKRGARGGRPDRPSRLKGGRRPAPARREQQEDPQVRAERSERLAVEAARAAAPGGAEAFAGVFRAALLGALEEIGAPVTSGTFALAHSRAALATWDRTRLHPLDASRVRLDVAAGERSRLGVPALRGRFRPGERTTVSERDGDLQVPRAHALDGERVRRNGKR